MSDHVLINGDKASFIPSFESAPVTVQPGTLTASGPATVDGEQVCVAGDEASVSVNACAYTTPSHPISGSGTLRIKKLGGDQTARKTRSRGTPVLLVGSSFEATFTVSAPAMKPNPPGPNDPDHNQQYTGTGRFITTNTKFTGV
jgi:hypothetical protein